MTVYIENVILDNFSFFYLISDLSYKIGGVSASKWRSLAASAIGTVVAIFYPFVSNNFVLFFIKAALYALLSLVLFLGKKKKTLPLIFLAVTAAMGGGIFFLAFAIYGNVRQALYGAYDFSPGLIVVSGWILYRIIKKTKIKLNRRRALKSFLRKVRITVGSASVCVDGLIDSGNGVFDEKSTLPVMFLSPGSAAELLDGENPEKNKNFYGYTHIRDINGKQTLLPLFKPDKVEIAAADGHFSLNGDVLIGVGNALGLNGKNYAAILHPAMIQGG